MPTASTLIRKEAVDDKSHNHWGTVTLALQRRWRRVKEWYTESYPTCDTGEYEPSWVSARRTNLANCRFYRLPEELILQILGNLDYVSKAIALRTCGLFMRIMFDRTLFSQTLGFRFATDIRVWPPFEQQAWSMPLGARREMLALRKQVDRLLDRDRFCDLCRQFREDGRYEKANYAGPPRYALVLPLRQRTQTSPLLRTPEGCLLGNANLCLGRRKGTVLRSSVHRVGFH